MSTAAKSKATQKDLSHIHALATERMNEATANLDQMSALEIAQAINREDQTVALSVSRALPDVARAIDAAADALRSGGRIIYVGAGTSGRIGALDSSECPPTFHTDPKQVQYVIAGGEKALGNAVEANEDSEKLGVADIKKRKPGKKDVVIGIAASGRTPYTIAAVRYARKKGAKTVAVVCNSGSELGKAAEIEIVAEVGPEVLAGSTRMKAGTAQKMICNTISTGAMSRLGFVYGNLMVRVHTKNEKLVERGIGIVQKATSADRATAATALEKAKGQVQIAVIMLKAGVKRPEAEKRLKKAQGNVRRAIEGRG